MQLAAEDLLKLNVMMAQKPRAVRIDENRMQVVGLTDVGEAVIALNPNDKPIPYLRRVREFLSGHITGSPGGYPVHISGWTRMGQIREENLPQLLMLGEPEAVVAVVHAKALTPEIGHNAWWSMPESENARRMLEKQIIVDSDLGPILAEHLFEHLAFETEPRQMIESVYLMLQPGLLSQEKREKLWRISQRNNANLVGFLQSDHEAVFQDRPYHEDYQDLAVLLSELPESKYTRKALWFLSPVGQGYLETVYMILNKAKTQPVMVYLLNTLAEEFSTFFPLNIENKIDDIDKITASSEELIDKKSDDFSRSDERWKLLVLKLAEQEDRFNPLIRSMLWLAQLSAAVALPVLVKTSAEGTLMRRKLEPVTKPIFQQLDRLLSRK